MSRRLILLVLLSLGLAGCAGKGSESAGPTLQQSLDRAARLAFDKGQYAQAGTLYQSALQQALLADDAIAIIDARFNLALARSNLGEHEVAREQLILAEAERVRRGLPLDPPLLLLEATILYRDAQPDASLIVLDRVFSLTSDNSPVGRKAHFLAGLIAADREDLPALQQHIAALETAEADRADLLELQGALAAQQGAQPRAYAFLDEAAELRGLSRDYRGMTRILARMGEVAAKAGDHALAANYFLRAGRSAAQRNALEANRWLERAMRLGEEVGDTALVLEASEWLR